MRKNKTIIIGLVGSGKTTLYRKLNEEKLANAVEIELPQSCIDDEKLKRKLFKTFYNNKNIDTIISHPYYLPYDFIDLISKKDDIQFLEVPFDERKQRVLKRSIDINSECKIFSNSFLLKEEDYFKFLKQFIKKVFTNNL